VALMSYPPARVRTMEARALALRGALIVGLLIVGLLIVGLLIVGRVASAALPARAGDAARDEPPIATPVGAAPRFGTYAWPVRGPVLRSFEPPETAFGAGHRGIDIGASMGTPVVAAHDGVVAFAGAVAGSRYVSIDHPDGVRTTYSWLGAIEVRRGDRVDRGEVIASSGAGHPGVDPAHLHLGARIGDRYIDPMLLLDRGSLVGLVRLAPLEEGHR
jgi:murein DD-endopeptidase MepM/ murein hydrolase activator NlpD